MVVQIGLGHGRGKVGGVGQGGLLVTEEGAADDGARGDAHGDAQAVAHAHKRHADGADGGPGRARHDGHDGAQHQHRNEEELGREDFQPVVDDHGNRAAGDPAAHGHADEADDENGLNGFGNALDDGVAHVLPGHAQPHAVQKNDGRTEQQRDVGVQLEAHDPRQQHGDGQRQHQHRGAERALAFRFGLVVHDTPRFVSTRCPCGRLRLWCRRDGGRSASR